MSRVAVVTTASTATMDAAAALLASCGTWWDEADVHVVASERVDHTAAAGNWWRPTALTDSTMPIGCILPEADQVAWAMPRLLARLVDDYEICVVVPPECLVLAPPRALLDSSNAPTTFATPAPVEPMHSLTPYIGRLASRPMAIDTGWRRPPDRLGAYPRDNSDSPNSRPDPKVIAVTPESRAFLRDWARTVEEAILDVDQRSITWATGVFLSQAAGRTDVTLEGEHTLLHWSNYAAIHAGRATGPPGAIVDCDSLFVGARSDTQSDDPEVAWSLLVHRVHDSRPVAPLMEMIDKAQAAHPEHKETYLDIVRAQVWRAADPQGIRWGADDQAGFTEWLFEENEAGCTRLAHLACVIDDELLSRFPEVRFDPSRFRRWVDEGGRVELGFDPFDAGVPATHPVATDPPTAHFLAWRWNKLRTLAPGYSRRLAAREAASFLGPDPRHRRGVAAPVNVPVERATPLWGTRPRGLNLIGLFRSESGLGQASRASLAAVRHLGIPFTHVDVTEKYPSRNALDVGLDPRAHGLIGDVNLIHSNADEMVSMRTTAYKHRLGGRFNAAMWFWEAADLPQRSRAAFHFVDELWVASRYQQAVFGQYGRVPVHVLGLAAELPDERSVDRASLGWHDDELVFLFVYDALSAYGRKNPRKALDAFIAAFAPRFDGVRFVLKVSNLNKFPLSQKEIHGLAERYPAITVIDDYLDREQVMDLMAAADVYVSLHAAEGFGLTLLEAMALGTPVIATAYSGNMDFTTDDNSWLVDFEMMTTTERTGPYPEGSVWANPRTDAATEVMRRVDEHRDEIRVKADRARRDARETASLERYAARLIDRLDRVM